MRSLWKHIREYAAVAVAVAGACAAAGGAVALYESRVSALEKKAESYGDKLDRIDRRVALLACQLAGDCEDRP